MVAIHAGVAEANSQDCLPPSSPTPAKPDLSILPAVGRVE